MSVLDKLLHGVEVGWTVLGNSSFIEIANNGRKPVKSDLRIAGEIPYYGANNIQDYVEGFTHNGIYVLIAEDGTQSIENYSIQWATGKFWANNHVHVLRGKGELDSRFLYHYLKQFNFIPFLSGGGRAKLTKGELEKIPIPIPPLPVQKEIVRILDTFTELTAELTDELTARKKQYSYYREQLLSFEDSEVEWKTLGEVIIKSYSGSTPKAGDPKYYDNGTIPWLRTQEVKFIDIESTEIKITDFAVKNTATKWTPSNCVIIAISGATAGRSAINKIPLTTNQHCLCLEINPQVALYRYVFHWVSYNFENIKGLGQGARGDVNSGMIKSFKIPIPPLEEQDRIVSILDKFDILTTSISEGLPKEIELRKKQYEYYRDLLLTFPKNNIES
jgi:type I restriction enzyme S subunit